MSLKKNVLFTSIVVLTIFVKMVPAPENLTTTPELPNEVDFKDDQDQDQDNKFVKNGVSWEQINEFEKEYRDEINNFCEINKIKIDENPKDKTSIILYFKDVYNTFHRYAGYPSVDSNSFIQFLIFWKTNKNEGNVEEVEQIAKKMNLEMEYESGTFCPLPPEIKMKYASNQFQFLYVLCKALEHVYNGQEPITTKEFVTQILSPPKEEKSDSPPNPPADPSADTSKKEIDIGGRFDMFNKIWTLKDFNVEHFKKFLEILENVTKADAPENKFGENKEEKEVYKGFLKHFQTSMDIYYNTVTNVDINELKTLELEAFYYKRMLLGLSSIYRSYNKGVIESKEVTLLQFTQLMNNVAEQILEANKTKKKPEVPKYVQPTTEESETIEIIDNLYKHASPDYDLTTTPELPNEVDFKDVLYYVIAVFLKDQDEIKKRQIEQH